MTTTVTEAYQITIPAKIAHALGIQPGTRLDWSIDDQGALVVQVLPHRGALARRAAGMARGWIDEESNPIDELIAERIRESVR